MRLALIATFALCNMLGPLAAEEAADSLAAASVLSSYQRVPIRTEKVT
jgi:hypothetical protein